MVVARAVPRQYRCDVGAVLAQGRGLVGQGGPLSSVCAAADKHTLATDVLPPPSLLFMDATQFRFCRTLSFGSTLQDAISTINENLKQLKSDV